MNSINYNIVIDTKEPKAMKTLAETAEYLLPAYEVLPAFDYVVGNKGFERMTWIDFIGKIKSHRIDRQVKKMLESDLTPIILMEGNQYWARKRSKIKKKSLEAKVKAIQQKGIMVIRTTSKLDTIHTLEFYVRNNTDENDAWIVSLRDKAGIGKMSKDERQRFILEGFPGIGEITADKILKETGSLKDALKLFITSKKSENYKGVLKTKIDSLLMHQYGDNQ